MASPWCHVRQDVLHAARRFAQLRTQKTAEDFAEDMKVNLEEMAVQPTRHGLSVAMISCQMCAPNGASRGARSLGKHAVPVGPEHLKPVYKQLGGGSPGR